jgi:excisionase family DNA binding protein
MEEQTLEKKISWKRKADKEMQLHAVSPLLPVESKKHSMQPEHIVSPQQFLLTIPQVAQSLGVSRAMVYSLLAKGKGPPVVHLGRSVRVSVASLRKWIEEQEREQP